MIFDKLPHFHLMKNFEILEDREHGAVLKKLQSKTSFKPNFILNSSHKYEYYELLNT